jgi:gliding motility-associated-like protein
LPTPNFVYDKLKGCRPLCVRLWSNAQPPSINTIWDFGYNLYANGDSVRYCFEKPGVYPVKVFLVDGNGCKNTVQAPFSIEVYPRPEPAIYYSPSVATLLHNEIEFTATYNNGPITYWHWDFGDIMTNTDTADTKNAVYTYTYVGNFPVMLIATSIYGCTDTTYRIVPVTEEFTMYIPDAFTPNGDGLNDVFNVKGAGFLEEGFEMRIYDRWGELIFKTNNVYEGWNGKVKGVDAKSDVYIYKIRCFTTVQKIKKEFVGHVTLYR